MSSTITLQQVIDFTKTHVRMAPLVNAGGVANEPALSICNDTLQSLLSSPYAWRFNKNAIPSFTTIPYQQDYLLSGCQMSITTATGGQVAVVHLNSVQSANGPGISQSGTTVTVNFSDFAPVGTAGLNGPPGSTPVTTGSSVPGIGNLLTIAGANQLGANVTNAVVTGVVKSANGAITGLTFTAPAGLANDGGQGIGGINWLEHATIQDYFSTATVRPVHDIEVVASLPVESIIQPPFKICFQLEKTSVPATVTLMDANGQSWLMSITNIGLPVITAVSGSAPSFIQLQDVTIVQNWNLTVNISGQLQTTATSGAGPTNSLLLQAPNGVIWALQVNNGIIQTIVVYGGGAVTQIVIRTWPVPSSQIWNVFLYYQAKAPIKLALTQTWDPWPDDLGYVLRSGVKCKAFEWFEDPRYPTAEVKWQQDLLRALDAKDQEARSEGYFPDLPISRGG